MAAISSSVGFYGAVVNRWRGRKSSTPRFIRRISVAVIPTAACAAMAWDKMDAIPFVIGVSAVLAGSYLGICVGHGRYYTLGRGDYPDREDNWPGQLLSRFPWFREPENRYTATFDAVALAITGITFTLPSAVFLGMLSQSFSIFLLFVLTGAWKTMAYFVEMGTEPDPIANAEKLFGMGFSTIYATVLIHALAP